MAINLKQIQFADLKQYECEDCKTQILVEYADKTTLTFSYGEPDECDDSAYWFYDDGIGLDVLEEHQPSYATKIVAMYLIEVI